MKRRIGPRREPGTTNGLTKAQAERELRRRIDSERAAASHERLTLAEAGERYLDHLTALGRKRSTLMDYESTLRVHLAAFFGGRRIDRLGPRDMEAFIAAETRAGRATKSILNYLGLLHSIFAYSEKRGWCSSNPCKLIDKPRNDDAGDEIGSWTRRKWRRCCARCRTTRLAASSACSTSPRP